MIKQDVLKRIETVLDHGQYILGPEITELEQKLAGYSGRKYCISCGNGTDALLMALMSLNIGPGDAVFTTTFTFIATAEVIVLAGATPVFVDIDELTYNMDPVKLSGKIADVKKNSPLKPRAIITVDLFGLPANYEIIEQIAEDNKLILIEDGAQSFGAEYKGKKACSFGEIATTSFFPAKPLGCYGDGGAIFTDNDEVAGILKSIRVHGKGADKYDNIRIGLNGRLDTLQAAILLAKFEIFNEELIKKESVASYYSEHLASELIRPSTIKEIKSAWAQYSLCSNKRNEIMQHLHSLKVPSVIYYPKPLHLQTAFSYLKYSEGDFPVAEKVSREIFSLPMHAYLTNDEQHVICDSVNSIVQK
jgi:dTDP-4-amino-4,6-dideoxygalactose transaminase